MFDLLKRLPEIDRHSGVNADDIEWGLRKQHVFSHYTKIIPEFWLFKNIFPTILDKCVIISGAVLRYRLTCMIAGYMERVPMRNPDKGDDQGQLPRRIVRKAAETTTIVNRR